MKFKLLAVLSIVIIIFGVAALGSVLQDLSERITDDIYLGFTMAVGLLAGGAFLYWAARRRYSLGWRLWLGLFLVFFGFVGTAVEADNMVNNRAEAPVFGFVLASAFAVSGFLVARAGYWRNRERSGAGTWQGETALPGHQGATGTAGARMQEPQEVAVGAQAESRK
jgi:hypothetical protein